MNPRRRSYAGGLPPVTWLYANSMPSGRQEQGSAVATAPALVSTTNSTTTGKSNRPRPLKLTGESNGHGSLYDNEQNMSPEETIRLMHQINQAVKAGSLTSNLSAQIFRLANELRQHGEYLEQTHKESPDLPACWELVGSGSHTILYHHENPNFNITRSPKPWFMLASVGQTTSIETDELGRVFLSLRQACCRDSGQLGTPCRLKIMELIELRAMGWRTNLAHSQYYMARSGQADNEAQQGSSYGVTDYGPVPVSAPPFGAIPVNPFAAAAALGAFQHGNAASLAGGLAGPPEAYGMPQSAGHQPQFYIIPANNVAHTQAGIAFVTPGQGATSGAGAPPGLGGPPSAGLMRAGGPPGFPGQPFIPPQSTSSAMSMSLSQGSPLSGASGGSPGLSSGNSMGMVSQGFPKGASWKPSGKFGRPQRVPGKNQFRDEIVIRNADSGKVMGIKGRRIAIIEELSKTIVSFQKVPPGAKERTLTITGGAEENIEQAKGLLDQTIRRNASPTRSGDGGGGGSNSGGEEPDDAELYAELALKEDMFTCSDPKLLELAKVALKEYFERHVATRRSGADDGLSKEERKERRKSMPPIPQTDGDLPELIENLQAAAVDESGGTSAKRQLFQSTPNLAPLENGHAPLKRESTVHSDAGGDNAGPSKAELEEQRKKREAEILAAMPKSSMRVVYTKEFLLQCSTSPVAQIGPPGMMHVVDNVPEVLRPVPGKFDPIEYKKTRLVPSASAPPMII